MLDRIKENRTIVLPISLIVALVGGAAFVTTLYAKTEGNTDRLKRLEGRQDVHIEYLQRIDRTVAEMKGQLDKIGKQIGDENGF